jgi:hypothetical protein
MNFLASNAIAGLNLEAGGSSSRKFTTASGTTLGLGGGTTLSSAAKVTGGAIDFGVGSGTNAIAGSVSSPGGLTFTASP